MCTCAAAAAAGAAAAAAAAADSADVCAAAAARRPAAAASVLAAAAAAGAAAAAAAAGAAAAAAAAGHEGRRFRHLRRRSSFRRLYPGGRPRDHGRECGGPPRPLLPQEWGEVCWDCAHSVRGVPAPEVQAANDRRHRGGGRDGVAPLQAPAQ